MVVFVARPIFNELSIWYQLRGRIRATKRGKMIGYGALGLVIAAILPIDRHVSAPAVLAPISNPPLVAGDPARIAQIFVRNGQAVAAGAPIMRLVAPELDREVVGRRVQIARLDAQMSRAMSDPLDMSNRAVLERQLIAERDGLAGTERRRAKLLITAPVSGVVTDLGSDMHPGRWLGGAEVVARIVTPGRYDVQAYVAEDDIWRIEQNARARFVPDDVAQQSRPAKLVEAASSAAQHIDQPVLTSTYGGPIAVASDAEEKFKPRNTVFRTRLVAAQSNETSGALIQPVPGIIEIDASGQSLLSGLMSWFGKLLAQEWSITS
jgi:putative peptide zinc metalloprotease protein